MHRGVSPALRGMLATTCVSYYMGWLLHGLATQRHAIGRPHFGLRGPSLHHTSTPFLLPELIQQAASISAPVAVAATASCRHDCDSICARVYGRVYACSGACAFGRVCAVVVAVAVAVALEQLLAVAVAMASVCINLLAYTCGCPMGIWKCRASPRTRHPRRLQGKRHWSNVPAIAHTDTRAPQKVTMAQTCAFSYFSTYSKCCLLSSISSLSVSIQPSSTTPTSAAS